MMGTVTPKEAISALIEQEDVLKRRLLEFEAEENVRLLGLDAGKESLQRDLRAVDSELSPKEIVAASKEIQAGYRIMGDDLKAAGSALAAAVEGIETDLRAVSAKRQGLQKIEHRKKLDAYLQGLFKEFEKLIQFYSVTSGFFYGTILPMVDKGFSLDPKFLQRSQEIGLRTDVYQALENLFRPGSLLYSDGSPKLNLAQTLLALQNMKLDTLLGAEPAPAQDDDNASLWPDGENPQFSNL